jgi:hypothetical protein
MSEKLTEPQKRALQEVEAQRVIFDGRTQRFRSTAWPPAVRTSTIKKLVGLGLVRPGGMNIDYVNLTDRGREVLRDE